MRLPEIDIGNIIANKSGVLLMRARVFGMNPLCGFNWIERSPVLLRMPADLRIRTYPQAQNRALSLKDFAQRRGRFQEKPWREIFD